MTPPRPTVLRRLTHMFRAATGPPVRTAPRRPGARARFDSGGTDDENRRHFAPADASSVDASASPAVRRTLRARCRYEVHNNSYLMGICRTVANYVVGTGPRLQVLTPDKALNAAVEAAWEAWAREVRLAETLWLMRLARLYNGESFALLRTNPRLAHPVKLDVFQVEADQVASPLFAPPASAGGSGDRYFDGVVLDPYGRPLEYHVLRQHPGASAAFFSLSAQFDAWPARYVLHDFKRVRPGQQRGIPEVVPALSLIAKLRRYTDAVVAAAETAADVALAVETQGPADPTDDAAAMNPFDTVEFRPRMGTVLPDGYRISQIKAEQPTTTFDMFANMLLREVCRCLDLPAIFASLDARDANMSSAYVVAQPFAKAIEVDRAGYVLLLDRVLAEFLAELSKAGDVAVPDELREDLPHHWMWPSIGSHADPDKVAAAQQTRLGNGTTSIPREFAKEGLDWEAEQEADAKSLGLDLAEYRRLLVQKRFGSLGGAPGAPGTPGGPDAGQGDGEDTQSETDPETDAETDAETDTEPAEARRAP